MVIGASFTPESPVVLVVEDDDKLASLIGRMLDRAGYDCVLAPTGRRGVAGHAGPCP